MFSLTEMFCIFMYTFSGFLLGVALCLLKWSPKKRSDMILMQRLGEVGCVEGKTLKEIAEKCGNPFYLSFDSDKGHVYMWLVDGFYLFLWFDENYVCTGKHVQGKLSLINRYYA